ncbi:hypothetical protein IL092_002918 [Enterococcus faecalis]|uniref:hypothetical protein n=1 Tax=Enterococcus sp. FR128 TaxID=2923500 RepID=UPI0019DE40B1|nr:hypothetical protein [Enterococcus sp. FR128]EGO2511013.1 hypothetical protein [Enterococcus faecalis]MDQ8673873.1 hypothetical protein [Enterococcus sp. FR128]
MKNMELQDIYKKVLSLKMAELDVAIDNAESEEEKDFYLELYNYKLASKQKEIINQKDFTI